MDRLRSLVLVGGPYHDGPGTRDELSTALSAYSGAALTLSDDTSVLSADRLSGFDVVVVYTTSGKLAESEEKALDEFVRGGKGLFGLHSAAASFHENRLYHEMLGSTFLRHPPLGEVRVDIIDHDHPVTAGVRGFAVPDELYLLHVAPRGLQVLAEARLGDEIQPSAYVRAWGAGRVCFLGLGHDARCLRDESFRRLAGQGLFWAAGR